MTTLLILNGPNLNLLGEREPEIYGRTTLADIEAACTERARGHGLSIDFRQSNHEGELVDWIQETRRTVSGIVINPAGLTTTSVPLHDALKAVNLPAIEVHISNIFKREAWRHHSYISPVALGTICGLGPDGYLYAIDALANALK